MWQKEIISSEKEDNIVQIIISVIKTSLKLVIEKKPNYLNI
jgi:hypothetical protein